MATQAYPPAGAADDASGVTSLANFIPEIWSDEIIASYTANLVAANLLTRLNHVGKKGDTIHIPAPTRASANAKAEATGITIISNVEGKVDISINKHYEYSRLIEDIANIQALDSFRMFYTEDAGRALATQVDTDLILLGRSAQGGNGTQDYTQGTTLNGAGVSFTGANGASLTDAGIRTIIQSLDDADVPMDQRSLVIPPSQKNVLLGLATGTTTTLAQGFARADTTGDARSALRSGLIGDVYGVPVYVTTNVDTDDTVTQEVGLMFHKEWVALVEQMTVRTQTQYKQEYLADLLTADTIYGVGELRDTSCMPIIFD